jgi:hypothetical protein
LLARTVWAGDGEGVDRAGPGRAGRRRGEHGFH